MSSHVLLLLVILIFVSLHPDPRRKIWNKGNVAKIQNSKIDHLGAWESRGTTKRPLGTLPSRQFGPSQAWAWPIAGIYRLYRYYIVACMVILLLCLVYGCGVILINIIFALHSCDGLIDSTLSKWIIKNIERFITGDCELSFRWMNSSYSL